MTENDNEIRDVIDELSALTPNAAEAPRPASQVLARLKGQLEPQSQLGTNWRIPTMFNRKYMWAALSVLVLLIVVVSIPGVRAAASDFLGLFRVQKFAPLSISAEQLSVLGEIAESGLYPGEIEMLDEPGPAEKVNSREDAAADTGWQARSPSKLGDPDQVYLVDGGSGRLTINVENTRALVRAAGADPDLIPDSLDGAVVDVTLYPSVSQNWADGIVLVESPSPLVEYPEDVNTAAIGEALLQALGMDPSQARRLSRSIDWTSTVLLPIPEDVATFNEVGVDGVEGLAFSSLDGNNSAILWQKDGMVYVLSGGEVDDLVDVANSLR
jgi:hypothetical protein